MGFVDPDTSKAEKAASSWGGEAFPDVATAFDRLGSVDVVTVAAPDATHSEVLRQLVGKPCKLIFAEKPFTRSAETAKQLLADFEAHGQTVAVNYTRRFASGFQKLASQILTGKLGKFLGGSGFYGNGLFHNGSHMFDMLLMLAGGVRVKYFDPFIDAKQDDPSVFALLTVGQAPFYLGVIPRFHVNAFEATLYFSKAAIRITDVGRQIEILPAEPRPGYEVEFIYTEADGSYFAADDDPMTVAVQNIADHLTHGTPLLSPAENAVRVLEICEALS